MESKAGFVSLLNWFFCGSTFGTLKHPPKNPIEIQVPLRLGKSSHFLGTDGIPQPLNTP